MLNTNACHTFQDIFVFAIKAMCQSEVTPVCFVLLGLVLNVQYIEVEVVQTLYSTYLKEINARKNSHG